MRGFGRRVAQAAALALLLALVAVPTAAFAADPADPSVVVPSGSAESATTNDVPPSPDAVASVEAPQADQQADPGVTQPGTDATPAEGSEAEAITAPEGSSSGVPGDSTSTAPAGTQVTSQANPDAKDLIDAVLRARKHQFDLTVAALQRSIDQLAVIVRRLDAADVNTAVARARLAEARGALSRAKAAERITVVRYRSVMGAEDISAAYASARTAGRSSSLQLERARVKVLTAAKILRAIVKNVTV